MPQRVMGADWVWGDGVEGWSQFDDSDLCLVLAPLGGGYLDVRHGNGPVS
jgi:hypothetical protein